MQGFEYTTEKAMHRLCIREPRLILRVSNTFKVEETLPNRCKVCPCQIGILRPNKKKKTPFYGVSVDQTPVICARDCLAGRKKVKSAKVTWSQCTCLVLIHMYGQLPGSERYPVCLRQAAWVSLPSLRSKSFSRWASPIKREEELLQCNALCHSETSTTQYKVTT